ncbi:MAG: tetraacyldisaccharide 4'-kinase [Fimbriimonadales bacterium]
MPWRRIAYPETPADRIASAALLPLSWLYGLGWRSYEAVYRVGLKRRRSFDLPIVGVGNLTVGGSGKTPVVAELVRLANKAGISPALSLSGYGSPSASTTTVLLPADTVDAGKHGDEPAEIRRRLPSTPLIIGRDRVAAAEAASDFECLILDDGFQHLPLARKADLVLWDDDAPNKRLLPAGPLREPNSGIRRATAVATPNRAPAGYGGNVFHFEREYLHLRDIATDETLPLAWLRGKQVDALCAIARPDRFFAALRELGADVRTARALGDHDPIEATQSSDVPTIVTEKDATKIAATPGQFFSLVMRIRFTEEEAVVAWLTKNLSR